MSVMQVVLAGLAALAAGFVNALAGGGTLITFPALLALGIPPVAANVTNTVALCPGYLGATLAQRADLAGQVRRLWLVVPASIVGGIAGGVLLLHTSDHTFRRLIPYLILLAAAVLFFQDRLRAMVFGRDSAHRPAVPEAWVMLPIAAAAIYGGYFGAGVSVMVLAALGLVLADTLTRLNALKQAIAFSLNVSAAIFFVFSGRVVWPVAAWMAAGALAGGALGGRLAGRIAPIVLRRVVVSLAVIVAIVYFVKR